MPAINGNVPPSGWATGMPFSVTLLATYVVFAGTTSRKRTAVAGTWPLL